jgi:response regulator RpfG family c-di-GMP phosphodiesterase
MTQFKKRRLDEILVEEGLISQAQINDALMRQKMRGGKFGSQLLYHRYIDEPSLVKALSIQFGCEGVVLSDVEIPDSVARAIPSKLALTRMVMPFDFDAKTGTLKIACENPTDPGLINEINFVTQGKKVKLFVAAELVLETIINRHYLGRDADLNDKLLVEIPDTLTAAVENEETAKTRVIDTNPPSNKTVLFVTDEEYAASLLESVLSREGYEVTVVDSLEAASREITCHRFSAIFIRETAEDNLNALIETVRKTSPRTTVQVYKSAGSLVLHDESFAIAEEILSKNLSLFTSLLSTKNNLTHNHSATVGQYADKLCRRLGLSSRDRMYVVMAAYLHDLARYYFPGLPAGQLESPSVSGVGDYKAVIESSKKLLSSFDYSGQIIGMLSLMYKDLKTAAQPAGAAPSGSASLELLGANIITIVDLFCENIVFDRNFTLEKFDAIKKRLRDFTGKLFFAEVVEAFIGMMQEEILSLQTAGINGRIQFFSSDPKSSYPLLLRLKNEGFQVATSENIAALVAARSEADTFLFDLKMDHEQIGEFINQLSQNGFDLKATPAVLLVGNGIIPKLGWLFERGIEDVMSEDLDIDLMILKLRRLLGRALEKGSGTPNDDQAGAKGRLADMNLIDLVQALAPGRRTVKITVWHAKASADKLTIFLDKGIITFAQLGNKIGAEAIYDGMTWADGVWTVEPVMPENLPVPNNALSNDAILMEGAYRLDEKMRAGKLS